VFRPTASTRPSCQTLERSQAFESSSFTVALHVWPRSAPTVRPSAASARSSHRPAGTVDSGTSLARVADVVVSGYRSLRARSQELGRSRIHDGERPERNRRIEHNAFCAAPRPKRWLKQAQFEIRIPSPNARTRVFHGHANPAQLERAL
jgi:hypothetical protein